VAVVQYTQTNNT